MSKFILSIVLSLATIILTGQDRTSKMNGISLVGTRNLISESDIKPVLNLSANWITVMPFAFIPKGSAKVQYNQNFQWSGETVKGIKHTVELAKKSNLKVLLKPHIWMHYGWIGDFTISNDSDWKQFEESYTKYILEFANLAASLNVEVFCIGVELKRIVIDRPRFFLTLIKKVREVYSGKLTYAANWDNYQNVSFWKALDFIGIDAYFPVSESKTPSYQSCYIGWKSHFETIKKLSTSINKKVIFTEFGYRNIDFTGKEPWNENANDTFNSIAQVNSYRAIFARFWGEDWFAGGFLWKWFPNHQDTGGTSNNRFTPQNKPVENTIKVFYGSN
jgi:hypothetical protein